MSGPTATRAARWARRVHVGALVILGAAAVAAILGPLLDEGGPPPDLFFGILTLVVVIAYTTLGRLIVTRTGNRIGWVFLAMGSAVAIGLPAEGYVQASFDQPYVASLPASDVAGWVANLAPALIALAIPMLFLLFPTGSPPTRRWRWVGWLWLEGAALSIVWLGFRPGSIYGEPNHFSIENPLGVQALSGLDWLFLNVGTASLLLAGAASIVSLVVRFRRARAEERQQIRWLMFVGVTAVVLLGSMIVLETLFPTPTSGDGGLDDLLWVPLVLVLLVGPPAAAAIAVFRYHLYDLDVVISKALVFTVLAVFVTGLYVGVVAILAGALDVGTSDAVPSIAAITAVAVAFDPVRVRARRLANRLVYGRRASPYDVLARFSDRVGGTYATTDVLPRTARVIAEGIGAERAEIWLHVGDDLRRATSWPPTGAQGGAEPKATVAAEDLASIGADRTVPVRLRGELLGAIAATKPRNEPFAPHEVELLDRLAEQAAFVLANARLTADLEARLAAIERQAAELRASRQRIVTAQDEERKRLERNIHDGAQQHLVALAVKLRLVRATYAKDRERGLAMIAGLRVQADAALDTLDALSLGIYPPLLQEQGIAAALAGQYTRSGLPVHMRTDGARRYPLEIEAAVYFCALEALQNAAKYADATQIAIDLSEHDGMLTFEISDDGRGFDASAGRGGTGIDGMRDRLAVFGGAVEVTSSPGGGTSVRGSIPLPGPPARAELATARKATS